MITTGFHRDVPMADYLKMKAVGQGVLQTLLDKCPRAAWFESHLNPNPPEPDDTEASDIGTIGHKILVEGSTAGFAVIDPNDHPTEKTGNIPDGWTNKSIRTARDIARESGLTPILKPKMAEVMLAVESARAFIDSLRVSPDPLAVEVWKCFQMDGAVSECTMVWEDDGVLYRARPDKLRADNKLIVDPKFTAVSAEPDRWGASQMVRMGYYTAAAHYRRGVQLLACTDPEYVFLVIETAPPYLCSLVGVSPRAFELGEQKMAQARKEWKQCLANNRWPGYPTRVAYPEIPEWEENRWNERLGLDEQGIPYDPAKLFERSDK